MTRDQRKSLWLGHAIAGKLVTDPDRVRKEARSDLSLMRTTRRGAGRRWLDEWDRLLRGPVEGILEALTSRSPRSRELRQNSPFAGVLSEEERHQVLSAFRDADRRSGT
jgi:hypothetical protein